MVAGNIVTGHVRTGRRACAGAFTISGRKVEPMREASTSRDTERSFSRSRNTLHPVKGSRGSLEIIVTTVTVIASFPHCVPTPLTHRNVTIFRRF